MPWKGDDKILDIVRSMCQELNITSYNPSSITWKSEIESNGVLAFFGSRYGPRYRPLPYDECVLTNNTVILPEDLQEKLEPDDWKPIIASALVYKKTLLTRRIAGITLRLLVFVGLAIILFIGLPVLFPSPIVTVDKYGMAHTNSLGWLIASYLGPLAVIIGTSIFGIWYLKSIRLLADRDAADIVGASTFVAVLEKISALDSTGDGMTNERRSSGVEFLPPIRQRIANLRTYSVQ